MATRYGWPPPVHANGWPRVADPFFSLSHSDRSGRPRLHQRALAVGLSAALLAELVLAGQVEIGTDQVKPVSAWMPRDREVLVGTPTDPVASTLLHELLAAPHIDVAGWLSAWEDSAYERVVGRLLAAGQVEMVPRLRFFTTYMGYQPVNRTAGVGIEVRLGGLLSRGDPLSPEDTALCGLMKATGMSRKSMWPPSIRRKCRRRLDEVVDGLRPSLAELVSQTKAFLDRATVAPS